MQYVIQSTKTNAGKRQIPITENVARCFQAIIEDRGKPKKEQFVDGYCGFLYFDENGMPLVEKCVTVDGGCVREPRNVIAPIGTAIRDLFEVCGGLKHEPAKYVYGGPMMGVTVPNDAAPVLKATNAVLALRAREAKLPKTTNCIRCGSCTNVCPFGLAPAAISHCVKLGEVDALEALHVDACMECGCCSFVCPANRPLVQRNQLGKAMLREEITKEGVK